MASSVRSAVQIDKLRAVSPRPKKMQVLCLGLSRTGTLSLCTALIKLGYTPYHGTELFKNSKDLHIKCWVEGLTAKYYTGKTFGRAEFDKLLGDYDTVTDAPCANFPDELIAAYPEAKVVLTSRTPDSWVRSMESLYYPILRMYSWNPVVIYDPNHWGAFRKLVHIILVHLTSGDPQNRVALRSGFILHNEHVRSIVPKDNLLDFQVQDGWEPLCRFLGKPIPYEPFPHINEGRKLGDAVRLLLLLKALKGFAVPVAVGLVSWAVWHYGWKA